MELYKCNDDNKNVDKKSAKLYDIRVLFEDYLSIIMQDPAQQKNHAKSWPPYLSFHDK